MWKCTDYSSATLQNGFQDTHLLFLESLGFKFKSTMATLFSYQDTHSDYPRYTHSNCAQFITVGLNISNHTFKIISLLHFTSKLVKIMEACTLSGMHSIKQWKASTHWSTAAI